MNPHAGQSPRRATPQRHQFPLAARDAPLAWRDTCGVCASISSRCQRTKQNPGDAKRRRFALQNDCASRIGRPPASIPSRGGGERNRTVDLMLAKHALSQLSYTPETGGQGPDHTNPRHLIVVGLGRLELPTSRLSGVRSNRPELQAPKQSSVVDDRVSISTSGHRTERDAKAAARVPEIRDRRTDAD